MRPDLVDVRVLIAEDELLIAIDLELGLLDLGCKVIGPFPRLRQVIAKAETEAVDIALLDMNLNGELVFPVIDILRRRLIPLIVISGYGDRKARRGTDCWPALTKPYRFDVLTDMMRGALDSGC
ncbi:MAG: response regulator [Rubritepida sp.]|nr:response regulator [Rubritepida sp.]